MKEALTRREALLGALGASLTLSACDRGTPKGTDSERWSGLRAAARSHPATQLRILGENLPPLQSLQRIRGEFTSQTGAELEIDLRNHSNVIQSVLAGALNRDYQYDLIFLPHKELGRLREIGAVTPLDRFSSRSGLRDPQIEPREQFFNNFWTQVATYNGEWLAVPLYLGGSIVVYRNDLLSAEAEQARFRQVYPGSDLARPRNFVEWERLARYFTRPQQSPPMYGIGLLLSEESLWYEWQSMLFAFGGNVLDTRYGWEYGDIVVNSPAAVAATEAYRRLATSAPPDAASYSWGQGIAKQQSGQDFMTLLQYDVVAEFEDPQKTPLAGRMDYFLPVGPDGRKASQVESWVGVIPVSARAPEMAWLLLQWIMGPEVQLRLHLEGNVSPRRSTYEDRRVRSMRPTRTILESLNVMTPKPTIPEAGAIQQILTIALQDAMSGRKPVPVALNEAATQIERRLGGRSRLRFPT